MNLLEKEVTSKQNLPSSQLPTAYLVDVGPYSEGESSRFRNHPRSFQQHILLMLALIQRVKAAGSATFGELSQKYEAIVTSTLRLDF